MYCNDRNHGYRSPEFGNALVTHEKQRLSVEQEPATPTVRALRADDHPAVHDIFTSLHVAMGTMRIPYQSFETTSERLSPCEGSYKLVADVDDIIVGYAELETFPNQPRHRHAGDVNLIAVHADWQGEGVGRRLMESVIDLADNWIQLTRLSLLVWENNQGAINLYTQCGFGVEGRLSDYVFCNGQFIDALCMGRIVAFGNS